MNKIRNIETGEEGTKKPKRLAIPKQTDADSIDIILAQKLEVLPRTIGKHLEDGLTVSAGIGPYGPYLLHNKKYTSLKNVQDVFEISLGDACQKIIENLAKPKRIVRKKATKKKA